MSRTPLIGLSLLALVTSADAQDVPLELWTNATWPNGAPVGNTNGASWGDYDADGWPDMFAARSGRLLRNVNGEDWELFTGIIPGLLRYGSSFGDYNNDGLPDIATEPRAGGATDKMELLLNLGGGPFFQDVATDPNVVDLTPFGDAETNCWADVDHDGNLDLFVPVYPPWAMGGAGNFFLYNLGPTGPGGAYHFTEISASAGLDNPAGSARPEGAEFCDVDGDGDLDLYSNTVLYQNNSTPGNPSFVALTEPASGFVFTTQYDEGCAFGDHDLDGDMDLFIAYCGSRGVRIYENEGDGTFDLQPKNMVASANTGLCLGLSRADWDNDGDIDFSTRSIFRKNMLMETGKRGYVIATTTIPAAHTTSATPAWADADRDGDLDCLLGNWTSSGHYYESTLYDAATPSSERRYVRVRVMRDSDDVERGLETEYGALAEVFVEGDPLNIRRIGQVSSAGGYLNQDEYTMHFALPADPAPNDDTIDLRFDVHVDFNSDPAEGIRRIDRHVNPRLGNIALADLDDREITVFRSGRVTIDGCTFEPVAGNGAVLVTTTDGLALTDNATPLPDPAAAPGSDWYVGMAFDTSLAAGPLRIKEIVLDGVTGKTPPVCASTNTRMALWDTTDPANPFIVPGGDIDGARFQRNDRSAYRVDIVVEPARQYRLVARVDDLRATTVSAPVGNGGITVLGGLSFQDPSPCDGAATVSAGVDAAQVYVALRFADDVGPMWADLGYELPGTNGTAQLEGQGELEAGSPITLDLKNGPPSASAILISSTTALCRPLAGGLLVPALDQTTSVATDANGDFTWLGNLPPTTPPGTTFYFQVWWADPGAPKGRASSNALSGTTKF